jgi:hypothetical protein
VRASGHLGCTAVAAAQRSFHEPLEIHRGVLTGEVQVPVPPPLDAVEAGVRIASGPGVVRLAVVRIPGPGKFSSKLARKSLAIAGGMGPS